jgi:hypothetical protein
MSGASKTNNPFEKEDNEFSELFYQFLKDEGRVLPQTIEEVEKAEEDGVEMDFSELPPALQNPQAVFERRRKFELRLKSLEEPLIEENKQVFRRAARHGQELTPEIKARMEIARAKAESEAESENDRPKE